MKPNRMIYDPAYWSYYVLNGRVYRDCQIDSVTFHGTQTLTQFFKASQYLVKLVDEDNNEYQENISRVVTEWGFVEYLSDIWDEVNFANR
ncbi:hypothetical protein [Nostoc sp. ATCC 53789]|uniref:hypothetical protein n=1 Tax=Nostoc sp. ATCC 53789 TaxID=76335 RepID=UPI000DED1077|nr:hypothetical protein [Nostoc sp. ATCC 53789]QHG15657.1 hypothetical protein GJB62_06535 [Nostoc sp. ATCC 53789]RCJ29382.1 hypothetical protein A6V25_16040 [Nostoc sp. ATCC 53789]